MGKHFHRDIGLGAVLLIFSSVAWYFATKIKGEAAVVPIALTFLMGVCSVLIIVKGVRETRAAHGEITYAMSIRDSKAAFLYMLFIAFYYLGFRYITYWIATPLFMIISMKYLKQKSWKLIIFITAAYMIVCYVMFVIILKLPIYRIGIFGRLFRYV